MCADKLVSIQIDVNDLNCPICLQLIRNPRLLHCGHRICNYCYLQSCSNSKTKMITCGICKRESQKTNINLDTFFENIIQNIEYKFPCGQSVLIKNTEKHNLECLVCLKEEFLKLKEFSNYQSKELEKYQKVQSMVPSNTDDLVGMLFNLPVGGSGSSSRLGPFGYY